jgi:hypothetical protein
MHQLNLFPRPRPAADPAEPRASELPADARPPEAFYEVHRRFPPLAVIENAKDEPVAAAYPPRGPSMAEIFVLDPNTSRYIGSGSTWTLAELAAAASGYELPDIYREPPAFDPADGCYWRNIDKAEIAMADLTLAEIGCFHTFSALRFRASRLAFATTTCGLPACCTSGRKNGAKSNAACCAPARFWSALSHRCAQRRKERAAA